MEKFDTALMHVAVVWSRESYCKRRQVGAVISKDGKQRMSGFNGTLSGLPNQCEDISYKCPECNHESSSPDAYSIHVRQSAEHMGVEYVIHCNKCHKMIWNKAELFRNALHHPIKPVTPNQSMLESIGVAVYKTNEFTLHAEQNVLSFCGQEGISTNGCTIHVTTSPCKTCAKLLAQHGIKRVVYLEEYRDDGGIDYLKKVGIKVEKYQGERPWETEIKENNNGCNGNN